MSVAEPMIRCFRFKMMEAVDAFVVPVGNIQPLISISVNNVG